MNISRRVDIARYIRFALAATVAVAMSMATLTPAFADDLEDYLDRAAAADYAGRQIVVTVWEGQSTAGVVDIERTDDLLMMGADGSEVMAGAGKASNVNGGVVLADWGGPLISDRYSSGSELPVRQLGRDAIEVEVLEDGVPRARIVFDLGTWAPMAIEVLDGTGEVFRYASLTSFDPSPERVYAEKSAYGADYDIVSSVDESGLPSVVGSYERLDVYRDQDGVLQAFYGDGLFSYSVFVVEGDRGAARFANARTLTAAGHDYGVLVNPTDVWVRWQSSGDTYLLVGDLPPDHLETVLSELPEPGGDGLLSRLWRGLFGN